ncbi:MAG: 3-oxoacyl-ACP reductase FabG [Parachlamydiaceae bacterium]
MNQLLTNQVAIVTGGNAGIGKAIAFKLAEDGAKVAIMGTNSEAGHLTVAEIKEAIPSSDVRFYKVDVSLTSAVDEAVRLVVDQFGKIDLLVNNAGITADQLLMKMSEEDWDRVITVNLKSCYNTCHAVVRPMMKARKGKIINVSSVVGLIGNPGQTNYAASKAGMIGFSKALAKELASRHILVNCVAPGFISTKMTDALTESQKEVIIDQIPLKRLGEASEVAHAVWFLASPLCLYMTGQVITIDGGMVM